MKLVHKVKFSTTLTCCGVVIINKLQNNFNMNCGEKTGLWMGPHEKNVFQISINSHYKQYVKHEPL